MREMTALFVMMYCITCDGAKSLLVWRGTACKKKKNLDLQMGPCWVYKMLCRFVSLNYTNVLIASSLV